MIRALVFILSTLPISSFACSCLHQPLEEHVESAKNIYLGVLMSSKVITPESEEEWPYIEGTLKVETVIKGNPKKIETIRTGFGGGDCGIPMTTGRAYVIFFKVRIITLGHVEPLDKFEDMKRKILSVSYKA